MKPALVLAVIIHGELGLKKAIRVQVAATVAGKI